MQIYLYKEHSALGDVIIKEVNVKMGKTKLKSDAERGMFVHARRTDDNNPETMILIGKSRSTVFRGLRE
ncbi:hypothetical protein TNCT_102981 [Trichonephila clavata]|uniref:Uncharacterized protein n=1 Tax=Trichonephila clavata TaxID=2740835 RepID=A0A8X6GBI9_TRICU|nr:hypothetical protein TNCT_102981 [Trichonephila clavata]